MSELQTAAVNTSTSQDTREAWSAIAPGYDHYVTPSHLWLGAEALRRAGLRAGMRFLDVAAGSGALSMPAARLGANVLATDHSPAMLEILQARARREGLAIETRVMDGQALGLEDNTFDVAGSQFGVMLFPDMPRGIREMARVIRPGGRVLLNAFGDPRHIEFLAFLVRALQVVRPDFQGLPMDPPPLPLQLHDPQRVRREFANAALRDITVETVTETLEFPDGGALWDWLVNSNPIVEAVLGDQLSLSSDERRRVREKVEDLVSERAGANGPAKLTNPVHIAIGVK